MPYTHLLFGGQLEDIQKWPADSQHTGCQFDSSMCHFQNVIGEVGNGKPPHEFHFPRKNSGPCLWFLLRLKLSMQCSFSFLAWH